MHDRKIQSQGNWQLQSRKKKQYFYWLRQKWENKLDNLKVTWDIQGKGSREENEW